MYPERVLTFETLYIERIHFLQRMYPKRIQCFRNVRPIGVAAGSQLRPLDDGGVALKARHFIRRTRCGGRIQVYAAVQLLKLLCCYVFR